MADTSKSPDFSALLEEYGNGASDAEIARCLKITTARFYDLIEENEKFAEFVNRGRTLARAWWEAQGRKNLWTKEFNVSLWNFNMKNRFGWADKMDTNDTTDKDPVDLNKAESAVRQSLQRLAKSNPELLSGLNLTPKKDD